MMRLLFIAPLPPPFGGMSVITRSLFEAGLSDFFEVVHLNTSKNSPTEKFGKISLQDVLLAVKNYFKLTRLCIRHPEIRSIFLIGTCDSGIIRDAGYIFILKLFSRNIIFNLHGTRKLREKNRLIRFFTNYALKRSEFILSPTKIDMDGVAGLIQNRKKLKLFYNSVYISQEYMGRDEGQGGQGGQEGQGNGDGQIGKPFRIVGLGRLSAAKGAFDLIEVCAGLIDEGSDIHLTWIGKGAYPEDEREANRMISENQVTKGKIDLQSGISEEKKYMLLRKADIFVLPTYSDNLPVAILEAMAMGLPVISTTVGAIPEVIQDKINGWLVSPGDKDKLREYIVDARNKKSLLDQMGANNRNAFHSIFTSLQRIKELKACIADIEQ
ncbi:MAG: glycosyltransferase family 4 protein [Bacteroidia bacterium]|nr:glycosyltransferase family 4 protein [Bacteroidia bacterium]